MYCEMCRDVQKSNYIIDLKFRLMIKKKSLIHFHSNNNIWIWKVNYYWQQRMKYSNICSYV